MTRLNILLVTQNSTVVGGSDVVAFQSKYLLEKLGHQVTLFCSSESSDENSPTCVKSAGFDNPSLTTVSNFIYSKEAHDKIDALLKVNTYDVAYLHIYYGKITGSILGPLVLRNIPIIQHNHEFRSYCAISTSLLKGKECSECKVGHYLPAIKHKCNRASLARSLLSVVEMYVSDYLGAKKHVKHFIAVSDFQRNKLVAQGIPMSKITTIHNAVSTDFNAVTRKSKNYVLFAGRIEKYKGVYDVIEVASRLDTIKFIIAGDGRELDGLKKCVSERELRNVKILGKVSREEICTLLSNSFVTVVPSKWPETFGLAAAESLAAGVPVIAYDNGGLPEVVQKGASGFVIPEGDIDRLSSLITYLKSLNPDAYRTFEENSRNRAKSHFSEEAFSMKLESILLEIVKL